MKKFLKDYFTFNKRDRNGIIILISIIFILLLSLRFMNNLIPEKNEDFTSFNKLVAELEKAKKEYLIKNESVANNAEKKEQNSFLTNSITAASLFPFNPNNLPAQKWKELGLSEKQIKTLKHYEEKGGKFYKKEDVRKIYGIQPALFKRLEPYIDLPVIESRDNDFKRRQNFKKDTVSKTYEKPFVPLPPLIVELNSADTLKLKNLKGIGSTFAKRIITYREKLGGFISFNQLYEIWGVDSETVKSIIPQLTLNPAMLRKIPLNHCNVADLKKHPYLNYNIANNIVLYRDRHGDYAKLQDIKLAVLVNDDLFRKIAPYLTLD